MPSPAPARALLAPASPVLTAIILDERERDTPGIALPRPEIHLVARFGPTSRGFLDVSALGIRERVYRKTVRAGQRTVMARLRLGGHQAVLGVRASEIVGRVVSLEDLWGDGPARRLGERLAAARSSVEAAAVLERAIAERAGHAGEPPDTTGLVLEAARELRRATVGEVAATLGVSERHLRRVFREAVGVGPKTFARLERFRAAVAAACGMDRPAWAGIALSSGYYDQAHLIAEFCAIAGVTPQVLVGEIAGGMALG